MNNEEKTYEQLLVENSELRQRLAAYEEIATTFAIKSEVEINDHYSVANKLFKPPSLLTSRIVKRLKRKQENTVLIKNEEHFRALFEHSSQKQLRKELTDTKLLQEISSSFIEQDHVEGLYEKLMDAAVCIMGSDFASLQMLYPERGIGGELRLIAYRGFTPQAAKFWEWVRLDSDSTCGIALRTGRRVIVQDVETCDFMNDSQDQATYIQTGIRAVQTTPLLSRSGKLIGMFSTHWRNPHQPVERDLCLLEILARQAADLIERKQIEAELIRIQRGLLEAQRIAHIGNWEWNIQTGQVGWSDEIYKIYGLDLNTYMPTISSFINYVHPDDQEIVNEIFKKIMSTGMSLEFDFRMISADGSIRFLHTMAEIRDYDENGNPRLMVGINQDITERKNVEEALRESEERYRLLAQKLQDVDLPQSEDRFAKIFYNSPDIMNIICVKDDRYIEINQMFTNVLEYTREEVLGHTPEELNLLPNEKQHVQPLNNLLDERGKIKNYEVDFRAKSGKIINALCSTEVINLNDEICRLSVIKDLTNEKATEKELFRLDRLNLVGEMAAGIGHEIRNPMTSVRGFLQILSEREKYKDDSEYFQLMIEELDRGNSIIREYLSLARNKTILLKPHFLNSIINTLHPMIEADANYTDKQIRLELGLPLQIHVDENEIRQLIMNLARNGLEAMNPGGMLTIRTRDENGEVVLEVEDQGCGIPKEILDRIGTPFQTTKENGTGLGLAVCYSIANRLNAKIDVETGVGGTTFRVKFRNDIQQ